MLEKLIGNRLAEAIRAAVDFSDRSGLEHLLMSSMQFILVYSAQVWVDVLGKKGYRK